MKIKYILPILLLTFFACQTNKTGNTTRELASKWQFKNSKESNWKSAVVPGSIHQDLMDHKLIPDPFVGENEKKVQWVEKETWEYQTTFALTDQESEHQFVDFNFEGIDTYSSIYINDSLLSKTDNMFREYRFTVPTKQLKPQNILRIVLHSPRAEGEKIKALTNYTIPVHSEQLLDTTQIATSNLTRKAHYHYGWDWGPRLVTSGIWKPVSLHAWSAAKLKTVFYQLQSLNQDIASYQTMVEIESNIEQKGELLIEIGDENEVNQKQSIDLKKGLNKIIVPVEIKKPTFWYPHNYGDPFLYKTKISLKTEGILTDTLTQKLGVRDLKIIQKPDSIGNNFYVEVNGTPIFCKGANYIPPHFFNGRLESKDYKKVIENAYDANMNMLRVWGGGVYEKDEFYELCDQYGILVWQDFMFACNMYRGDQAFLDNVEEEARQNVKRLRTHPSVALWIGNNEILRGWTEWGWQGRFGLDSTQSEIIWKDYQKIFYGILDKVIKEEDPQKLYWPSSPSATFGGKETHKSGDSHFWDVWFGQKPFQHYHDVDGRFVSEFGFQSFPDIASLTKIAGGDTSLIGINTAFMQNRQRCKMDWIKPGMNGNLLIKQYLDLQYGEEQSDFEDFVYKSQLLHADALKEGIEAFRLDKPNNMGAIFWQIDDCWPTVSWSSVDFYGNWKAPHYAAKRANNHLFIGGEWQGDSVFVAKASYDGLEKPQTTARLQLLDEQGSLILSKSKKPILDNSTNALLFQIKKNEIEKSLSSPKVIVLTIKSKTDSMTNVYHLTEPKNFRPLNKNISVKSIKTTTGFALEVSSSCFQRGVRISSEQIGFFTDNYVDLIPNQVYRIQFDTQEARAQFEVKALGW